VLRLLARGLHNKQIARELNIAEGSVKQHVHHVFRALGVSSRVEALITVGRRGVAARVYCSRGKQRCTRTSGFQTSWIS
jgi:DNA-binding NarL/FixJ family response regulator